MSSFSKYLKGVGSPGVWKLYLLLRYLLLLPSRAGTALSYLAPTFGKATRWLFESRETSNFSYDLSPINTDYLAHCLSIVTGQSVETIRKYINEIETNKDLERHVKKGISASVAAFRLGPKVNYGRRIGWYVIARALKPKIIVETGVEQGLGSCILAEALRKNKKEGKIGKYFGIDILPETGALFTGIYENYGEILYGDSIKTLMRFNRKIDLFISDSDHRPSYERREYEAVRKLLGKNSVILGDNSLGSEALCRFAESTGRNFIFFQENPKDHWYPGGGIGIAYGRQ